MILHIVSTEKSAQSSLINYDILLKQTHLIAEKGLRISKICCLDFTVNPEKSINFPDASNHIS